MKDINMKKLLTALTLTALTSTVANAAGYGVVDLERVVENSTYLKQQNSSFQQKIQTSRNTWKKTDLKSAAPSLNVSPTIQNL